MLKKIDWLLMALLGLGLLLRLPQLDGSFWLDEAAQALESARPLSEQLNISGDFQPPLLHFIIHFALYFGQSEWWLRTAAALMPGLGTIGLTYFLAKSLKLSRPWLAPLLLATSSFHIFYSQELRPYSLPALWASLSWWLMIKQKPLKTWAVVSLLGLYSSYLYPFLLLTQLVYLGLSSWQSKLQLKLLAAKIWRPLLIILLGFLPWLPHFLAQLQTSQLVIAQLPGWTNVVATPQLKVLMLTWGKFIFGVLDIEINPWFSLVSLLIFLPLFYLLVKILQNHSRQKILANKTLLVLLIWVLLPLFLAWLISFLVPILQPKRVLYLLPGFYLLVNYLLDHKFVQGKVITNLGKICLMAGLSLTNLYATFSYFHNPKFQRENWRGLIEQLKQRYPEKIQTTAIFAYQTPFSPWEWYNPGFATQSIGKLSVDLVDNLSATLEPGFKTPRVVTFDYLTDLTDQQRKLLKEIAQRGYRQTDLLDYPLIGFIRIYEK